MKYLVLFLMSMFPLLSISAQNLEKMDSVQRNKYLIDLSSEVTSVPFKRDDIYLIYL